MNRPQPVTHTPGHHALFIVLNITDTSEAAEVVRAACEDFSALERSMSIRDNQRSLRCVMGFGSDAWDRLFRSPRPADLHPFIELRGDKHTAPSTPGDILLHIRGNTMDICFEFARLMMEVFGDAVTVEDEVHAFRYFDGRSMVGFVDGTENPVDQDAFDAAVVGEEDSDFAGGSYVVVQKYLHDMKAWNGIPTEEQERVIGRTKMDDIELDDDTKPVNAHNAVTVIEDDEGNELSIVRANLPFGSPASGEFGTYFIGYARYIETTERMLQNMFIGEPKGNYDRLLDFSTAVTGSQYFVPSLELLGELAEREPKAVGTEDEIVITSNQEEPLRKADDGSLIVGSLKNKQRV